MKLIFKTFLRYYLKYIAKLTMAIHRPDIIAIAGSTNKTFVKNEIIKILKEQGIEARSNPRSFNTEIGLPLAVLDLPSGYNFYKNWLPAILKAPLVIFRRNFPRYLVLELGVSNPGDMKYLLSIIKPRAAIITDITQRYLESFSDMDKLSREYEYLVKKMQKNSVVILNYDNIKIRNLAKSAKAPVEFFSLQNGIKILSELSNFWQAAKISREDQNQVIKVNHNNIVNEYKLKRFGQHHIYSLLIGLIIKKYVLKE